MSFKAHNPGCPCCLACVVQFESISNDLTKFDVESGTWTEAATTVDTSSSNAELISKLEARAIDGAYLRVRASAGADGDVIRLIIKWLDSDNYFWAEFTVSTTAQIKIGKTVGGTKTALKTSASSFSMPHGGSHDFYLCWHPIEESLRGSVDVSPFDSEDRGITYAGVENNNGTKAGVGTGGVTGTATFGVFDFERTDAYKDECPECPTWGECAWCDDADDNAPKYWKIVLAGVANGTGACGTPASINQSWIVKGDSPIQADAIITDPGGTTGDQSACRWSYSDPRDAGVYDSRFSSWYLSDPYDASLSCLPSGSCATLTNCVNLGGHVRISLWITRSSTNPNPEAYKIVVIIMLWRGDQDENGALTCFEQMEQIRLEMDFTTGEVTCLNTEYNLDYATHVKAGWPTQSINLVDANPEGFATCAGLERQTCDPGPEPYLCASSHDGTLTYDWSNLTVKLIPL